MARVRSSPKSMTASRSTRCHASLLPTTSSHQAADGATITDGNGAEVGCIAQ